MIIALSQSTQTSIITFLLWAVPIVTFLVLVFNEGEGRLKFRLFVSGAAVCLWAYLLFSARELVSSHGVNIADMFDKQRDASAADVDFLFTMAKTGGVVFIGGLVATICTLATFSFFRKLFAVSAVLGVILCIVCFPLALFLLAVFGGGLVTVGFITCLVVYVITLCTLLFSENDKGAEGGTIVEKVTPPEPEPSRPESTPQNTEVKEEEAPKPKPEKKEEPKPAPVIQEEKKPETKSILLLKLTGDKGSLTIYPDDCPRLVSKKDYLDLSSEGARADMIQCEISTAPGGDGSVWMIRSVPGIRNTILLDSLPLESALFLRAGSTISLMKKSDEEPTAPEDASTKEEFASLSVSFKLALKTTQTPS